MIYFQQYSLLTYPINIFDVDVDSLANKILHCAKMVPFNCPMQWSHLMGRNTITNSGMQAKRWSWLNFWYSFCIHTSLEMRTTQTLIRCTNLPSVTLTPFLSLMWMLAPCLTRNSTVKSRTSLAAMCRGVH